MYNHLWNLTCQIGALEASPPEPDDRHVWCLRFPSPHATPAMHSSSMHLGQRAYAGPGRRSSPDSCTTTPRRGRRPIMYFHRQGSRAHDTNSSETTCAKCVLRSLRSKAYEWRCHEKNVNPLPVVFVDAVAYPARKDPPPRTTISRRRASATVFSAAWGHDMAHESRQAKIANPACWRSKNTAEKGIRCTRTFSHVSFDEPLRPCASQGDGGRNGNTGF